MTKAESKIRELVNIKRTDSRYKLKTLLSYDWAKYYMVIGARGIGKTYQAHHFLVGKWANERIPFVIIRLSGESRNKLLCNNAVKLIDPIVARKFGLELRTRGMDVYDVSRDPDMKTPMCKVLALSEFAKEKGVSLYDGEYDGWIHILVDEFQLEKNEVKRFDPLYNLAGSLENLLRDRMKKIRIIMCCNMLEESNSILEGGFNFIPEEFGIYKLKRKDCVIWYAPNTKEYMDKRKKTAAGILMGDQSNFTNEIAQDRTMISKEALVKPLVIIKFTKKTDDWYTVWNDNLLCKYNKEQIKDVIAMRAALDERFSPERRDRIIGLYDSKMLCYRNMIVKSGFEKRLQTLKGRY